MTGNDLLKGIHNFYTVHQTISIIGSLLCIQIAIMQTNPRIVSVFRKAHFNAAHRLNVPSWTEEQNRAFFGLCNNAHYHGHNYELEVKVQGEVDEVTGYLIDMKVLKDYIDEEVVERFDHKNLNLDTEEFKDINPTAENIVWVIWERLRARLDQKFSLSVRLYETPRNFVEYNG
jgi:6-pyruvoyltetrahydropterin/6-carboxytetrahydropterin synthase